MTVFNTSLYECKLLIHNKEIKPEKIKIFIEYDAIILKLGEVVIKKCELSCMQVYLMNCLSQGITKKQKIIDYIWGGKGNCNKLNKLVFNTRKKIFKSNLPGDIILTIPKHGFCLNSVYFDHK